MTISEFTLKSSDLEPARRFEVFTGSGRRRAWLPEEKARIVAESYDAGESVSTVAQICGLAGSRGFAASHRHSDRIGSLAACAASPCRLKKPNAYTVARVPIPCAGATAPASVAQNSAGWMK